LSIFDFLEKEYVYNLVDVRTPEEFESGYIQNAKNYDFKSDFFENDILNLDINSNIIIYCRTQNRSMKAAEFLKSKGYKNLNVIEGGITSWVKNGNTLNYNIPD
tara:strand:+ start:5819 stop:6130 length:312 start_codon:yes stop_codon:yes gene_type:complete